jgi:beta-N-acetylhexosaminidase
MRGILRPALVAVVCILAAAGAERKVTKPPARSAALPPIKASATVRRWMRGMTLRDEVAQLVFIPFNGESPNSRSRAYRRFVRLIEQTKVGGLVLTNTADGHVVRKAEPYALAAFLNRIQRLAKVPLMVGADFERGASMRVDGTTVFPHAMAFGAAGAPELARYEGQITAREARALGVHWVYYPVADVNNNPDNPIINIRSFGENPQLVAVLVKAFIEGAHSDKHNFVLTTAKHFPGHGDTAVDSHLNLPSIGADRQHLENVELAPFRAAIEAGVDSIMTAHIAVPALAPPDLPATLSPAILTDLLRKQLGFQGLVVTDALDMGGIAKGFSSAEAAVRALEAGADALLMPADPEAAIHAVVAAVESGRLSRQRIRESVVKVLSAKERVDLGRRRVVDLEGLGDVINGPEASARGQEVADRAVTLVRNYNNIVPLANPQNACYVVMTESRGSSEGREFVQQVRMRARQAAVETLDPSMSRADLDAALARLASCQTYAVEAFATVAAYRGSVALAGDLPHVLETLETLGKPLVLVALGSPYLLRDFPNATAYLATFSNVPPSEIAAVRALWGEMDIRGRLPVSIPGQADWGDGIQTKATRPAAPADTH